MDLPILLERFPETKAYPQKDVHQVIGQSLAPMHGQIAGSPFGASIAPTFVVPNVLDKDHLMLEGERIEILPPMAGDTALITPVHIPTIDTLIATDVAFVDTHLWMQEAAAPGGVDAWRDSIKSLQSIGAGMVIPGHRKPGSPNGVAVFDATLSHLDHWEAAVAASADAEELKAALQDGKEDLAFGFAVDSSVAAVYPES